MQGVRYMTRLAVKPSQSFLFCRYLSQSRVKYLELFNMSHAAGVAQSIQRLRYRLDNRGSIPGRGRDSFLCHRVQADSGSHLASYSMGTVGLFPWGSEADHSPPSSAKVKNTWSYTSTPPHVLMAWCLIKHSDNFAF
jgi:hypothetical protein